VGVPGEFRIVAEDAGRSMTGLKEKSSLVTCLDCHTRGLIAHHALSVAIDGCGSLFSVQKLRRQSKTISERSSHFWLKRR
jgi:hypothetical protein